MSRQWGDGRPEWAAESERFLPTVPGTQLEIVGKWCAGHAWRRHHLYGVHRLLHRLHLLRDRDAKPVLSCVRTYPDPKARDRQVPDA